jgi:hypothetical protein
MNIFEALLLLAHVGAGLVAAWYGSTLAGIWGALIGFVAGAVAMYLATQSIAFAARKLHARSRGKP